MTEQELPALAKIANCNIATTIRGVYETDLENPFFPVNGCGIVSQEWCENDTSGEGTALLVIDPNRERMLCKNIHCEHYMSIQKVNN